MTDEIQEAKTGASIPGYGDWSRFMTYYMAAPLEEFPIEDALAFARDSKEEMNIFYSRAILITKLEEKCKKYVKEMGIIPEVEDVTIDIGKPSVRTMPYTKKLVESAVHDKPMQENLERLGDLYKHLDEEGLELLRDIRQQLATHYMPLSSFFYERDIAPSIKITV